jgi:hypothetical protein
MKYYIIMKGTQVLTEYLGFKDEKHPGALLSAKWFTTPERARLCILSYRETPEIKIKDLRVSELFVAVQEFWGFE